MDAVTMYEDPVVKDTVVVKGMHKIGYLCYTNYTRESEKRLQEVFTRFKAQGVTDVVLDLRYNGGGYAETSRVLSSMLAPASVVKRKDIFLTQAWNDELTAYFKKEREDTNEYFIDTLSVNMDLSRLYVLTLRFSASASEATMIGLKPYMNVIQIGEATHGKYYGGALLSPMVYDSRQKTWIVDKEIENWLMYLMVYRYADRTGDTSFSGGLIPDYDVEEDYNYALPPLGDDRDPLFGKAIELITGESVRTRSTQSLPHPHTIDGITLRSPLNGKMIQTLKR
jgi:C-terminal processing protease CtpA/Prc